MISIASPTYDINGHMRIDANPENIYSAKRRGSVTETLDGGVFVYDGGFSDSGTAITVSFSPTKEQVIQLAYLIAHYPQLLVCTESGAYLCVVSSQTGNGRAKLHCTIVEKIS